MTEQYGGNTKDKILRTAAKMFSERGYHKVTTREIAKAIGINSASIYYHFASKEEILKNLYELYTEEHRREQPDLNELMRLAETGQPVDVLMKSEFHYNSEIRKFLDQILLTATREVGSDAASAKFIRDNIFDDFDNIMKPLMLRLAELNKIKQLDIETFNRVLAYFCFSAAALNNSPFRQSVEEYLAGLRLIYSLIIPTQECQDD